MHIFLSPQRLFWCIKYSVVLYWSCMSPFSSCSSNKAPVRAAEGKIHTSGLTHRNKIISACFAELSDPSLWFKMQQHKLHHHWRCGGTTTHLLMARALKSEGEKTIRDNQACHFINGWIAAKWWWTFGRVEELMSEATWGLGMEEEKVKWEPCEETAVVQREPRWKSDWAVFTPVAATPLTELFLRLTCKRETLSTINAPTSVLLSVLMIIFTGEGIPTKESYRILGFYFIFCACKCVFSLPEWPDC